MNILRSTAVALLGLALIAPAQAQEKKPSPKRITIVPPAQSLTAGRSIDARALSALIDQDIGAKLKANNLQPAARSGDAEFLRRVYLDLVGVIPPPEKVTAFLASTDPAKRAAVIDELLADPRFGQSLAETWSGLMLPHDSMNRRLQQAPFQKWLAEQFQANRPLDELVRDLLTATGNQEDSPAVTYFLANNTVDKMTDNVSRMFLGVQLQCAQCHNHPFVDWTQNDYWGMAAFFLKTRISVNAQKAAKQQIPPAIVETNRPRGNKMGLPDSAKIVPARFLQGEQPELATSEPYRPVLARWLTSASNPYFAKAMSNRLWYHLFGRGLVNPVDDMHEDNAATHPELLATLTEQLKLHKFDTKYLVRAICNSEAYQRTSRRDSEAEPEPDTYAQRQIRSLTPEQLFDSLTAVVGQPELRPEMKQKLKMAQKFLPNVGPRDIFMSFFRVEDANPLEYQAGIPQALRLMNGGLVNNAGRAVGKATEATSEPAQVVERLYLTALSRPPSAEERSRLVTFVDRQPNRQAAYADILWALLNSSEFNLNH